ncbi:MAG: hypothetical protein JSY10_25590 [Paenibacillus sp.]|nr:hypothetical protein [Paenibacillus sp.]
MGDMMAKCISMLENEIFSPLPKSPSIKFRIDKAEKNDTKPNSTDDSVEKEQDIKEDDDVVEYEGSESSVILNDEDVQMKEEEEGVNQVKPNVEEPKAPVQNEASMIMALAGIKHIRDVLLGKQQFDSSAINIKLNEQTTPEANHRSDDWKWDLVDHKEAVLTSSVPTFNEYSQPTRRPVFIPQTSSSIISNDMDSSHAKDKPLPPIIDTLQVDPTVLSAEPKLYSKPAAYIPTNPTPPKQPVKYRIEDLLSDPELQLSSPKAANNTKFKWMLFSEVENVNSLSHSNSDLFKSNQVPRMSPRKHSSFIINKATTVIDQTGENSVDPLDAKNVDNRKIYDYDMF